MVVENFKVGDQMCAQGQVNPNIRSWLADDLACRVKIMCMNEAYCPGNERVIKWVEKGIDSHIDFYLDIRIDGILMTYDDDEIPDKDVIEQQARLDVMGHYYEEAKSYEYEIEKKVVKNIIDEMKSQNIRKDDDFESLEFDNICY